MFSFTALASFFALVLGASATPVHTRAGGYPIIPGDNGSCQQMNALCSQQIGENFRALEQQGAEFTISKECFYGAICWQQFYSDATVDIWIDVAFGPADNSSTSLSKVAQRLSSSIYSSLVAQGTDLTQQDFLDGYYTALNPTNGPWPENTYVIDAWAKVAAWTGFCESRTVPYSNLADWFQFSATSNFDPTC